MSRRLVLLGSLLLLATAVLWVADSTGIAAGSDQWSMLTLKSGLVTLAAALLSRLLSPITGRMAMGRCRVCGRLTERGHTYCLDHLQETVNATRDRAHGRIPGAQK